MTSNYWVEGVHIPHVGYGRMAVDIIAELENQVTLTDYADSVVFMVVPHMVKGWYEGQHTAVMTMWETSILPDHFRRYCPMFDTLIVPCDWNAELFASVHKNIHVVPLGIDHRLWKPQKVEANSKFRFMTGGSGWLRKGIDQVIKAFHDAAIPDTELIVKCPPDIYDDPKEYVLGDGVTLIREALSPEDERDLHATADCFVSASRGEGFGLIPLQQAALGNLVIAPAHTGHLMFSHMFDYSLSSTPEKATMVNHKDCGDWLVPDHDELVDAMRDAVKRGRPNLTERRARHKKTLDFSWANSAARLLEAHPAGGLLPEKKWVSSGQMPTRVRALKNVEADVGEFKIRMYRGQEADIPTSTLTHLVEVGAVCEI